MNKESDNTREEVELSQLVGAIIRDVAKARVQADQYSHLLSEKYKEKEDTGEQLVSFPVPRAEISDVEVKFKFAVSEIKEVLDSTETKIFFFNKILEKYTPILTEKYLYLLSAQITLSVPEKTSYQKKTQDHIAQWIKEKFICKESEDKKNLQIQKSEKINDLADALKKIPIPLINIFEEIQNKTHPIANDIVNLYKENPESFKEHLEIEKPELLAANNTDSGEVNLKFKDTTIKESIILKKEKGKWEELKTWMQQTKFPEISLSSIAYANGLWVAVSSRSGAILTSTDSISWKKNQVSSGHFGKVIYANNTWLVVGGEVIYTSKDAKSWKGSYWTGNINFLSSVAYANGLWVAVGYGGIILTSNNGQSWTNRNSNTGNGFGLATYINGIWMAVGVLLLTSSNGISWTNRNVQYLRHIIYSNNIWVGAGLRGIYTSSNGISWTKRNSTSWLYGLAHFNNIWIAVGKGGIILRSNNGVSWKQQKSNTTNLLHDIIYANGLWVVVGQKGTVLTSSDGISWYQQLKNIAGTLAKIAYDNGIYVAIGSGVTTFKKSHIKNFINELYELERKTIETQRNSAIKIQEVIKKDKVIESIIGEISNEKMKLRKDDQLIVEVNSEELEKMEEEKISEISFKTNIKNYKWLKEEENTFNLIPEE